MSESTGGAILACPNCGNDEVGENDVIPGTARGRWLLGKDGKPEFEPSGYTEICWDGQEVVAEEPSFCSGCCWSGRPEALVPHE